MKKTILQTLSTVLFVGIFMSSCLGESNMKTSINGPAYIKRIEGSTSNIAISNAVVFTDDFVKGLFPGHGRFYYLNATVNTKDGRSPEGAYYASSVSYRQGEEKPVVEGRYIMESSYNPDPSNGQVYLTSVDIALFSRVATNGIDDRWLFEYKAKVYKRDTDPTEDYEGFDRDNIRLGAVVLKKDQVRMKGEVEEELPKDQVVVRLFLDRVDPTKPTTDKADTATSGAASISLAELRRRFYDMSEEKLTIQFVYTPEPDKDGNAREDVRLGTWEESYKHYYMLKEKS